MEEAGQADPAHARAGPVVRRAKVGRGLVREQVRRPEHLPPPHRQCQGARSPFKPLKASCDATHVSDMRGVFVSR